MRTLALLALCVCTAPTSTDTDTDLSPVDTEVPACPSASDTPVALATGIDGGTEGIAFGPDGTLYVGASEQVLTIDIAGITTPFADVPGVVGVVWWNEALWAASWRDETGASNAALVEITASGTTTRHPVLEIAKPNFLTPTPWGTLLISDDFDTNIYERTENGDITVWATEIPSPNGMGWSPDGTTLYVANTFSTPAPLLAIPVTDGTAGIPTTLHDYGTGTTPDGLAVSSTGEVLVALNVASRVDVWDGEDAQLLIDDVPFVASLAFGQAPFDTCTVYATSLFGDSVWALPVGLQGDRP
jgi:gluconolactonase